MDAQLGKRKTRRLIAGIAALSLVALLAACGGGSGGGGSNNSTQSSGSGY